MNLVFQHITDSKVCELIASAEKCVTLYAPGVSKQVALLLSDTAKRGVAVRFLTDISTYALRLGFFDKDALHVLSAALQNYSNMKMFNTPGLRQGVLVIDNRSWAFAVESRFVEDTDSPCWSFPNGLEFSQSLNEISTSPLEMMTISPAELDNAVEALPKCILSTNGVLEGSLLLPDIERLAKHEEELSRKEAELNELKNNLDRQESELNQREGVLNERETNLEQREAQVQEVLQHYEERCRLQKIEFKVQNYKIQNCTIHLKPELLIDIKDARRLKMTYALYEKGEPLSDVEANYTFRFSDGNEESGSITLNGLQKEIDTIRSKYIYSLGESYGNVILLDDKSAFEEEVRRLEIMGAALHVALQDVLRQKAVDVLKVLYQELYQKGALLDNGEQGFLDAMQDEIQRISEKVFNLTCIKNYTIFQAKDYESEAFQKAVRNMLIERRNKSKKPIKVFNNDVKIVYQPLEWILSKEQSSDIRLF